MAKRTIEERVARLERLLLPELVVTPNEGGAEWVKPKPGVSQLLLERCWPGEGANVVQIADENRCAIYLEKVWGSDEPTRNRLAAHMNRGIVLYSDYLPIYKDIIQMMERLTEQLQGGLNAGRDKQVKQRTKK